MSFQPNRAGHWEGLETNPAQRVRYVALSRAITSRFPNGARVLDVGCGAGALAGYLRKGDEYFGLEPNPDAFAVAQRISGRAPVGLHALCHGSAEQFETRSRFDVIVFSEVLYYSVAPIALLERYRLFLRSGGFILVTIFLRDDGGSVLRRLVRLARRLRHPNKPTSNRHCAEIVDRYARKVAAPAPVALPDSSAEMFRMWLIPASNAFFSH